MWTCQFWITAVLTTNAIQNFKLQVCISQWSAAAAAVDAAAAAAAAFGTAAAAAAAATADAPADVAAAFGR